MSRLAPTGLLVAALLALSGPSFAADDPADDASGTAARECIAKGKSLLAEAVNASDQKKAAEARALFEQAARDETVAATAHYHIAYTASCAAEMNRGKPENTKKALEDCVAHLEKAIAAKPGFADAYALLSSCYGRLINLDANQAMILGPKSTESMQKALKLEPGNPRVVMTDAIGKFYTPPAWGGSKEAALAGLEKSIDLFGKWKSDDPTMPEWGHDEAYAFQALVLMDFGRLEEAEQALDKALKLNPKSGFVTHYLKPMLAQKKAA